MADPKSFQLSAQVHDYMVVHGSPPNDVQRALIDATAELGGVSRMQIAPEQGAFMTLFARAIGARHAIEIGTFTGYSALCIALGLPEDGQLICCDVSEEWTQIGVPFWKQAGIDHKIDLRIAPAIETLESLPQRADVDLSFIDADKSSYIEYFEGLMPIMRTGGVILVDNVLWGGSVADPEVDEEQTVAIRTFNDHVASDKRVDCVMLPISDGLTLLRKR
ncbi:MAG: class I SAM-dependent methyltransferase [Myxococcota bacterium]